MVFMSKTTLKVPFFKDSGHCPKILDYTLPSKYGLVIFLVKLANAKFINIPFSKIIIILSKKTNTKILIFSEQRPFINFACFRNYNFNQIFHLTTTSSLK